MTKKYTKAHKYYYTYKITNNFDDCYYYGCHATNKLTDNYMGSGSRLNRAYNKHGVDNFEIEWLERFDSHEEMLEAESKLVTIDQVKDKKCYNLVTGGRQSIGHKHTDHTKRLIAISSTGNKNCLGRKVPKETRSKISWIQVEKRGSFIHTPFGDFSSSRTAAKYIGMSRTMIEIILNNPDRVINNRSKVKFPFSLLNPIGKKSSELGFKLYPTIWIDSTYFDEDGKNINYANIE